MSVNEEPQDFGRYNGHEIYPMPMFITVAVDDIAAVSDWYVNALGFSVVFSAPAAMTHLRRRKYQDVLIVRGAGLTTSFSIDDLEPLAARARAAATLGASSIEGPIETPWNTRDLRVVDPAGNRLVFTSRNLNADPAQVDRMRKMLDAARR